MGIFEDMIARGQWMPPTGAFPTPVPPVDEAAAAAADAAAVKEAQMRERRRFAFPDKGTLAPPPLMTPPAVGVSGVAPSADPSLNSQSAAVQLAMDQAPAGTGVPFSTQAGMLAPPVTVGGEEPVPLPMERPADAGPSATDLSSRGANKPPVPILPPAAAIPAADASAGPPGEEPGLLGSMGGMGGLFGKLRTTLGDNSNTLLALGAGLAGAPNIGQGISRAAAAAIPARAADIKQALERKTQGVGYEALIAAGVPKNIAVAAMGDPAIKKYAIENYMADRKGQLTDIGFDRYGNPIKGVFDPYAKTVTPLNQMPATPAVPGTGPQAAAGGPATPGQPGAGTEVSSQSRAAGADPMADTTAENDVTGPDYMERLKETDPKYARVVQEIVNGDAPIPTGKNKATAAYDRKLRQDVLSVEPGMSDQDYSTRLQVRKSYTGGNDSKITKSINTTLLHAQRLDKAINDLDNSNILPSIWNPARNAIKGEYSEPYQAARGRYQTAVANFAKEFDFAVSGGKPTVSGTKHQMEGFKLTAPKAEQLEKVKEGIEFLKGRIDSHALGYAKGMKKNVEPIDFIDEHNRKYYQNAVGDQSEPTGIEIPGVKGAAPAVPKVAVGKTAVIQTPKGPVTIKKVAD